MKKPMFAAAICALACAAGCGHSDAVTAIPTGYCTAVAPIAIEVTVRDSASGRALADGASGTLRNGTATDTLFHFDSLTLAGGRTVGTYDVTVTRAGYRAWTRTGVQSNRTGSCGGVVPVTLTAALQPAVSSQRIPGAE